MNLPNKHLWGHITLSSILERDKFSTEQVEALTESTQRNSPVQSTSRRTTDVGSAEVAIRISSIATDLEPTFLRLRRNALRADVLEINCTRTKICGGKTMRLSSGGGRNRIPEEADGVSN